MIDCHYVVTTLILFIVNDAFGVRDPLVRVLETMVFVLDALVFVFDDLVRIVGDDDDFPFEDDLPSGDDEEVVPFSLTFKYFTSGVLLICTVVFN